MNYPLFDAAHSLARTTDPDSSKEAARDFVASGGLAASEQLAYQLIANYPGRTAKELEEIRGLERCTVTRRVNNLVKKGLVIRGDLKKQDNGRRAATLYTKTAFHQRSNSNVHRSL